MTIRSVLALAVVAGATMSANAWEFRVRFVERVGSTDVVLPGNTIDCSASQAPRNIRIQFGVFDSNGEAAPAGGFVGWNVGTLAVSGSAANSAESRNNGRISPFNFSGNANANGNPPAPAGDPFEFLTDIDATLGTQSPFWGFDGNGMALPQPAAAVRGINSFVSVYAFRIDPTDVGGMNYSVSAGGNLIAATEWRSIGTPTPPDEETGTPGSVTYAPFPTAPQSFAATLNVIVPAPGAAALLGLGGLIAARRRRA